MAGVCPPFFFAYDFAASLTNKCSTNDLCLVLTEVLLKMAGAFGGNSTEYSLKWNSHHSTIVSVLDSLLERESLVDVTLACEGKFINVHRFMLFACSPYFEVTLDLSIDRHFKYY